MMSSFFPSDVNYLHFVSGSKINIKGISFTLGDHVSMC